MANPCHRLRGSSSSTRRTVPYRTRTRASFANQAPHVVVASARPGLPEHGPSDEDVARHDRWVTDLADGLKVRGLALDGDIPDSCPIETLTLRSCLAGRRRGVLGSQEADRPDQCFCCCLSQLGSRVDTCRRIGMRWWRIQELWAMSGATLRNQ